MNDFLDSLLSDYNADDYLEGYVQAPAQPDFIPDKTFVEALVTGAEYDDATKTVKYSFAAVKPEQYKGIVVKATLPLDSSPAMRPSSEEKQEKWEQRVSNSRKKFFAVDAALGSRVANALKSGKPLTSAMVASHAQKKLVILVGVYKDNNGIQRNFLNGTGVKGSLAESAAGTPSAARTSAPVQQAPRPAAVEVTQEDDDGDGIPF